MRTVYHVELYKSCISSDTIRYNFLKKECTMFSYMNLAFQVIQFDINFISLSQTNRNKTCNMLSYTTELPWPSIGQRLFAGVHFGMLSISTQAIWCHSARESHATSFISPSISWPAHRWAHGTRKKSKRPHPGTQILSQIPEGGEGNRGQMPHICPWSPPLGLNIDRYIISRSRFLTLSSRESCINSLTSPTVLLWMTTDIKTSTSFHLHVHVRKSW